MRARAERRAGGITVIGSAIEASTAEGIDVAARAWERRCSIRKARTRHEVALTMYHDQGLIPVNSRLDEGVNVTLGLPFVRDVPRSRHGVLYRRKGVANRRTPWCDLKLADRLTDEPRRGPPAAPERSGRGCERG